VGKNSYIVWLAEDNVDDRILLERNFQKSEVSYVLKCFGDGEDLLEFTRKTAIVSKDLHPDVILLDVNMPRLNGLETLRALKNLPIFSKIPTFMVTSSHREDEIYNAQSYGANGFINKSSRFPFQTLADYAMAARYKPDIWFHALD